MMLEPKWDLPPGVYVEHDADAGTVDVLNKSAEPVIAHLADVMRSFGVVVGAEEGTVLLGPGERFAFYKSGTRSYITASCTTRPRPG
jgi:hypothetical protein